MDDTIVNGHADTDARISELELELRRERLVRENLAARVGALIAENLDLLVRLNEAQP
jgi:hypothetical protein